MNLESRLSLMAGQDEGNLDRPIDSIDDPRSAVMIAAFAGWNDAGEAATAAVDHLATAWDAELIYELDPEEFHDFQVNRPFIATTPLGNRELTWPTTAIWRAVSPTTQRTVLLVRGIEPSFRWKQFCREILEVAHDNNVRTVISVGALLADVPHTRPVPVTTTSDDAEIRERLVAERSRYEGPTGIVAVLQHMAAEANINALSLWAAVPHYVSSPPAPKATLALLGRLEELLGEAISLAELPEDALAWENGVNELARDDPEIAAYVKQLEDAKDAVDLPEATGDAIAREFERYLRRREDGGSNR